MVAKSKVPLPEVPARFRAVRRRAFIFAAVSLLGIIVALAIFEFPPRMAQHTDRAAELLWQQIGGTPAAAVPTLDDLGTAAAWKLAPLLVVAGVVIGILMGMLGMGGGVFKVSCMLIVFKMDILFARAVSIVTMFIASTTAAWHHTRTTEVRWSYLGPLLKGALPGAVAGALLGNYLQSAVLTHTFGLFTLFLALSVLGLALEDPSEGALAEAFAEEPSEEQRQVCYAVGGAHGMISGLLGISGGVIACPLQQMVLKIPLREAIVNTLLASSVVTGVAGVLVVATGVSRGDYELSQIVFVNVWMGIGCAVGGPLGARLSGRFPVAALHITDFVLVFSSGIAIMF